MVYHGTLSSLLNCNQSREIWQPSFQQCQNTLLFLSLQVLHFVYPKPHTLLLFFCKPHSISPQLWCTKSKDGALPLQRKFQPVLPCHSYPGNHFFFFFPLCNLHLLSKVKAMTSPLHCTYTVVTEELILEKVSIYDFKQRRKEFCWPYYWQRPAKGVCSNFQCKLENLFKPLFNTMLEHVACSLQQQWTYALFMRDHLL